MPLHISGITLHKGQGEGRAAADESRSVVSLVIEGPSGASADRRTDADALIPLICPFTLFCPPTSTPSPLQLIGVARVNILVRD